MLLLWESENLHSECTSSLELPAGAKMTLDNQLKQKLAIMGPKPWSVPSRLRLYLETQTTGISKKSTDSLQSNASSGPMNHFVERLSIIRSSQKEPTPRTTTSSTLGKRQGACRSKHSRWATWRMSRKSAASKVSVQTISVLRHWKRLVTLQHALTTTQ